MLEGDINIMAVWCVHLWRCHLPVAMSHVCSLDVFSVEDSGLQEMDPIAMEMATKPKGIHNRKFRE